MDEDARPVVADWDDRDEAGVEAEPGLEDEDVDADVDDDNLFTGFADNGALDGLLDFFTELCLPLLPLLLAVLGFIRPADDIFLLVFGQSYIMFTSDLASISRTCLAVRACTHRSR